MAAPHHGAHNDLVLLTGPRLALLRHALVRVSARVRVSVGVRVGVRVRVSVRVRVRVRVRGLGL